MPTDWNGGIIRAAGESGLWLKVDASRRRNDPHKRGKVPVSMVRLRCKSCRAAFRIECGARVAVVGGVKLSSEPTDRRVWGQKPGQPTPCAKIQKGVLYQMFEDKVLVCKDCGQEFTFTAGEQEFYAEKGFLISRHVYAVTYCNSIHTKLPNHMILNFKSTPKKSFSNGISVFRIVLIFTASLKLIP